MKPVSLEFRSNSDAERERDMLRAEINEVWANIAQERNELRLELGKALETLARTERLLADVLEERNHLKRVVESKNELLGRLITEFVRLP